jgi:hypothetical protein
MVQFCLYKICEKGKSFFLKHFIHQLSVDQSMNIVFVTESKANSTIISQTFG